MFLVCLSSLSLPSLLSGYAVEYYPYSAYLSPLAKIEGLSQKFYNTIPHTFPEGAPPAYIDNPDELRLKTGHSPACFRIDQHSSVGCWVSVGADLIQSLEQLKDAKEMMTEVRTHTHHTKRLLTTDDALAPSWAAALILMAVGALCVAG